MRRRKTSSNDSGAAVWSRFIDFLMLLAPSADKDMKANIFIDGSLVLIYGILYKFVIEPSFSNLNSGFKVALVALVLFAIYHLPYKAMRSCYTLFIEKLHKKGYTLEG